MRSPVSPGPPLLMLFALLFAPGPAPARVEAGEIFVAQLAAAPETAGLSRERAGALAARRAAPRLAARGFRIGRALLDGLPAAGSTRTRAAAVLPTSPWLAAAFAPERIVLVEAPEGIATATALLALAGDPAMDWVEPLVTRTLQLQAFARAAPAAPFVAALLDTLPNDPALRDTRQYGLYNAGPSGFYGGLARADVHALEAWRVSVGNNDVILACADTGIDPSQPELGGTMPDGSPRIVSPLNVTDEAVPAVTDSFGHGTPVAGVMAARTNNGAPLYGDGVAGVCGGDGAGNAGCRIMPIKIAPGHSGEATSFDIARAIFAAADAGARAMNLSFAGDAPSRLERLALGYALVRGCVVVAAAGNRGAVDPTAPQYPAAYAADGLCIQVGASDSFDERTVWSSYGPGLDLLAPGVNIWTTFMTYPSYYGASYPGYVAASGTSFAAPFVAGAVGLLAAARPELTDADFQHVIRESADDVGDPGVDARTGWGRLNVARALAAVGPGIGIWHDEVRADSIVADDLGSLSIGERGPGTLDRFRGTVRAQRFAAFATVTLPDSFADSARVWLRFGGTWAARGDFNLPYFEPSARVVARTARTFTLRGYLYRADEDSCADCPEPWIPLPPDYVRFGFTVLGPVSHGPPQAATPRLAAAGRLTAFPNPFRGALRLGAPAGAALDVLDVGGRVIRELPAAPSGAGWDGRDASGRAVPPGLYFVRLHPAGAPALRVVKLGG